MAAIFSFICSCCGEVHEGSPSFGFRAPDPYLEQPKEVQESGSPEEDTCHYTDEDGEHFFIRVCLEIPIRGVSVPFIWGVWVSLSQKSFERYIESNEHPDGSETYFGWLCNYLPFYENTYALKTQVHVRNAGSWPSIVLEKTDHPLSVDFHEGISISRAQQIAEVAMHQ